MFNFQRSLSSNIYTPNANPNSYPLVRSNFGWTDNNDRSLGHNMNLLTAGGFNIGPNNPMIPMDHPRFNQQLTEVRKTIITPHGIQIHTVVDIPAPVMLPRLNQNPLWDETRSLWAPPLNSMSLMNHNFTENVNLPISTPNWQLMDITSIPNVSVSPVLEVEPIRSYPSSYHTHHVPQLSIPNMNNWENLVNIDNLLQDVTTRLSSPGPTSTTPIIATKIEPDMIPHHEFDDNAKNYEEIEDEHDNVHDDKHDQDDVDDHDDGRTHSLPHQKHGPYTCPKCNSVFQISQTFAAHVLSHYKHETPAERRKRQIAKYKKKGLQVTQSPHGLTVAHKSFKERSYEVGRPRKNTNQETRKEFAHAEISAQSMKHPQFDLRRPSTGGSTVVVKEEIGG